LGQVSDAMEGSVRAMPARGPSPLDRLAEWQLVSMKESSVYDRDYVFQRMCDITNTSPMPAQASIPVYGRSGSIASLDAGNGAGTIFMEAFVTRPDDNIAQATTLGSYISLGAAARGPKEGITIAFPAADPICVYTVENRALAPLGKRACLGSLALPNIRVCNARGYHSHCDGRRVRVA
jgi:hypothetical protein